MKKDWRSVEKTFLDNGIDYQLRDWYYLCKIDNREFYYSPQKGKWRLKGKRVWLQSNDTTDFINQAKVYSPPNRTKHNRKRANSKSNSNKNKQKNNNRSYKQDSYKVREAFLAQFDYYINIQRKQGYKNAWIWHSLLDNYKLTTAEICWLCVVFNYSPWWAYCKSKVHSDGLSEKEVLRIIELNRNQWLRYFQHRWGGWNQRNSNSSSSTPPPPPSPSPYQYHLQLLQLKFPFTKEELKSAYRKKSLETHPDAGGTAEAFRQINHAYQVLSKV
ncbi:MAG: J domain-containing protein [Rivularia sp. (in: Bacteria)]|nr:J domain-containing protein [Rivularia sp. MS3]